MNNSKGSALIGVMIAVGLVSALSLIIPEITENQLQQVKVSRVRAVFTAVELRLRSQLSHPSSFQDCSTSGVQTCKVKSKVISTYLKIPVPGTACSSAASGCGVELMQYNNTLPATALSSSSPYSGGAINSTSNSLEYSFILRYTGKDLSIKDTLVRIPVSYDLLQQDLTDCAQINPNTPYFAGYDSTTGKPICRSLKSDCSPGQFLTSVDSGTLNQSCVSISSAPVSCGDDNQFVGDFRWNSNNTFSSTCYPRKNPFGVFPKAAPPPLLPPIAKPSPVPPVMPAGPAAPPTPSGCVAQTIRFKCPEFDSGGEVAPHQVLNSSMYQYTTTATITPIHDLEITVTNDSPGAKQRWLINAGLIGCEGPLTPGAYVPKLRYPASDPSYVPQYCAMTALAVATCQNDGTWTVSCQVGCLTTGAPTGAGG
ncbi:hypothetical protein [Bdellovibrio sp.]|uniref:hypothetical protein n=1 Tax=Bdellovibrio sp. TaxID=28201 RepID=UPI0039E390E6